MIKASSDDYYALLGIDQQVNQVELRRVWRRLARRLHPDHAGAEATAAFQRISAAYAVLSDPVARAAYDRQCATATSRAVADAPAKAPGPRRRAPGIMLTRLSGPLNSLLACGVARRIDGSVIELFLNATEASQGGMITISMRVPVRCPQCAGRVVPCAKCGGRGTCDELFSAWLAVPPEIADGTELLPSELLPGMLQPVRFLMRVRGAR
jgi:molecular chaperone DnaJ